MRLRLVHLYGDLMNLYGDRGNIIALRRRCAWRNIELELSEVSVGDRVDPHASDIQESVDNGAALLAICGGYQLLGRFFRTSEGIDIPGTGLFDMHTVAGARRMVGNLLIDNGLSLGEALVGFENHSGQTYLGPTARPLGRVIVGNGNNGEDRTEGARYRAAVGTYLHGPVLPKNSALTDWLIRAALQRRLGDGAELPALNDECEVAAHTAVADRVRHDGNVRTSIR